MSFLKKNFEIIKTKIARLAKQHGKKVLLTLLVFFVVAVFSGGVLWWRLRSFNKEFISLPPITDPDVVDPIEPKNDDLVDRDISKSTKIESNVELKDISKNQTLEQDIPVAVSLEKPQWQWPSENKILKSYGVVLWPTYEDWRMHDGIDIFVEKSGYIKTAASGIVSSITWNEKWGHVIEIKHGDNYTTVYKGEGKVLVTVTESLKVGDNIMIIEKSSLAESALPNHIHFMIKHNGETVDPESLLPTLS
ncbi:M23 family metallopeptidase [Clostridium sp. 'deep sea']|uniref:M23 family metallopeptidase n=1 Tax=Clostridium sp. 'deep sea' TaxID=2779445 RepID=UPI0018968C84|nr:M23 family metallopeptidase [Clostridium sp. 'deep sea']QOR33771.1 M23 family metallopeptidase [Clostridium sp. 'deep sea']